MRRKRRRERRIGWGQRGKEGRATDKADIRVLEEDGVVGLGEGLELGEQTDGWRAKAYRHDCGGECLAQR